MSRLPHQAASITMVTARNRAANFIVVLDSRNVILERSSGAVILRTWAAEMRAYPCSRGVDPIGAKISKFRVPDAVQRERSEAVRRCSGTFAKVVCVTIPGLQRTTRP